jgi:hypothetical protein
MLRDQYAVRAGRGRCTVTSDLACRAWPGGHCLLVVLGSPYFIPHMIITLVAEAQPRAGASPEAEGDSLVLVADGGVTISVREADDPAGPAAILLHPRVIVGASRPR